MEKDEVPKPSKKRHEVQNTTKHKVPINMKYHEELRMNKALIIYKYHEAT